MSKKHGRVGLPQARRRRAGGKGKGNRKSRIPRSLVPHQTATIVETRQFTSLNANATLSCTFALRDFPRASTIAPNFKMVKPKLVEWTFEPLYNTFQESGAGGANGPTIPYMYQVMNRTQDVGPYGLQDLQAMGAKPRKFNTKVVIKYKPNWCSAGLLQTNVVAPGVVNNVQSQGLKCEYGYVKCPNAIFNGTGTAAIESAAPLTADFADPDTVQGGITHNTQQYNGHVVLFDVATDGSQPLVCRITCTVHWHFKEPHATYRPDSVEMLKAKPLVISDATPF